MWTERDLSRSGERVTVLFSRAATISQEGKDQRKLKNYSQIRLGATMDALCKIPGVIVLHCKAGTTGKNAFDSPPFQLPYCPSFFFEL
jgi:hypothetical protein